MSRAARTVVARWQGWDDGSIEHLVLTIGEDGVVAEGMHVSAPAQAYAARYRIACSPDWRTRELECGLAGGGGRRLTADGAGSWWDEAGRPMEDLAGAIDPDLSISPFTNTLPIRRLDTSPGQGTEIVTAWVSFPDLSIHADPQRYTCLERGRRWRYDSRDSDFTREIEVDGDGLVVTYPGLFRRIL
ncbi:MAG TPA: putative glycolipid-binding domain-containing protein [Geminicoccus sp.]|jgi:hypothetical protein|uniref:putative glycolipid-binding domain-containing protein n=1 Tax=Geminicoccus sp. TaxID=2024832 RepID=UPI002E310791|nr:putative glycolipid-binding domain-containing protein [Geminicoccus sp.]HEX2529299.1 putative glycolipid-binding domain-containing protein [Geminicoccus sp.]